jgi:uncharacterized protein
LKRVGTVSELWRYPIKGLRGESLRRAVLSKMGVVGDREYLIRDMAGKILGPVPRAGSGQRSTLELEASMNGTGQRSGLRVAHGAEFASGADSDFEERLGKALGTPIRVEPSTVLATRAESGRAVHVIADSSLRALKEAYPGGDFDVRRFRPNIVVALDGGDLESWLGKYLALGEAILRVEKPNDRCIVTTLGQGGLPQDKRILETITETSKGVLGVMCSVKRVGAVSVGDKVLLADGRSLG